MITGIRMMRWRINKTKEITMMLIKKKTLLLVKMKISVFMHSCPNVSYEANKTWLLLQTACSAALAFATLTRHCTTK